MASLQIQLGKIRRHVNSSLASQQQVAGTLYAIEETLKEQGNKPTPASYFASLLTLLEQQQDYENGLQEPILYLLAIILPFTPQPILRAKFTSIMGILSSSIDMSQAEAPVIKSVIKILETLLVNLDPNGWNQTIASKSFQSILILATDPRPKVRKTAQDAAAEIMVHPPLPLKHHPVSNTLATFCLKSLKSAGPKDSQALIHLLQLIKITVPGWSREQLTELCDPLIQLPKLNSSFITTAAFDTFGAIFEHASANFDSKQIESLLSIIVDMKPNINDAALSSSWHKIISHGYTAYAKENPKTCFETMATIFEVIFSDLELGKPAAQQSAANTLRVLLFKCIPKSGSKIELDQNVVLRLIKTLTSGLGYRFKNVWPVVLLLVAVTFESLGRRSLPAMISLLELISSMRMESDFEFKAEADATLGAAVSAIGPEEFLKVLPLNIEAVTGKVKDAVGRAWLLPLMKGYIHNTPLSYFKESLLPIADNLTVKGDEFKAKNRLTESRIFEALTQQIWALFSGFCDAPIDIVTEFDEDFAARLGAEIHETPHIRPYVCTGLQRLVQNICKIAHSNNQDKMDDDDDDNENIMKYEQANKAKVHISQFSPNFLLVLFNVFSQTAAPSRGYLFDTIQTLLLVTPKNEINSAFERVHGMFTGSLSSHVPPTSEQQTKLYIESNPPPVAHTMLDLLISMVNAVDREQADKFISSILPLIKQEEDHTLQKKAYKALYRLCDATEQSETVRISIRKALLPTLIPALTEATESTVSGSKRERLALLALLVKVLPSRELHIIPSLLSEAIISTKEVNEKARIAAFDLLLSLGHKMQEGGVVDTSKLVQAEGEEIEADEDSKKQASLEEFFKMALAGLAATTQHMISATITALARLMFEFHTQLRKEFMVELLDTTLLFVNTNSREIAKSSLGFVKVAVVALPNETLAPFLQKLVHGVLKWSNEHKNRLKTNARHIIERLVRRFGIDKISRVTPEEHAKLINNIRKRKLRSEKKAEERTNRNAAVGGEGFDDDLEKLAVPSGRKSKFGDAYQDALYGSESEISDSENEDGGDSDSMQVDNNNGGKASHASSKGNARKQKGSKKQNQLIHEDPWIHEDASGPLDFLDHRAFSHMSTAKPSEKPKSRSLAKEFKVKDGRLVIEEESDSDSDAGDKQKQNTAVVAGEEDPDYYRQMVRSKDGFTRSQGNKIKFNKRKSGEFDNDDDEDEDSMQVENAGGQRGKKNKNQRGGPHAVGKEYKAKGAKGDVLKKGRFEPYAYIPLNPSKVGSRQKNLGIKNTSKREKRRSAHGGGRA
ncbi:pre-rRNA processing protein [Mycoemilia scoparia]|uniref:Pre-rRNA processing protein n=1 Tax=Mycoemilia scoparia TaxID=417184 RepID=A0A9W8A090_9FUNG|nr:pre-rRNA processing protein [Mycoemilia scoparia]